MCLSLVAGGCVGLVGGDDGSDSEPDRTAAQATQTIEMVWVELKVADNPVLRAAGYLDRATLRAALASATVGGAPVVATGLVAPAIAAALVVGGAAVVVYVLVTTKGLIQREGPHIVSEHEVNNIAAAAAAGTSIFFASLDYIDAARRAPRRRCSTPTLDRLNKEIADKCKGPAWQMHERIKNKAFWKRHNSCFHEKHARYLGQCSPMTNKAKRLLECLKARATRRRRCYGGEADRSHAGEWNMLLDYYFSCFDRACTGIARTVCGGLCEGLVDEGALLSAGVPIPVPAPEPTYKTYKCGSAHANHCYIDTAQRARFADAGYGCMHANARAKTAGGQQMVCTYNAGVGHSWSACLVAGGKATTSSSATSADAYGTLRRDAAGTCKRCYHHPSSPTATAWSSSSGCGGGSSGAGGSQPATPPPPSVPDPEPEPQKTPKAPSTPSGCAALSCCATLADPSKLIPPSQRTFNGKVASDNFCFIADKTACCYRTHCAGDWTAGFNAATVCGR